MTADDLKGLTDAELAAHIDHTLDMTRAHHETTVVVMEEIDAGLRRDDWPTRRIFLKADWWHGRLDLARREWARRLGIDWAEHQRERGVDAARTRELFVRAAIILAPDPKGAF